MSGRKVATLFVAAGLAVTGAMTGAAATAQVTPAPAPRYDRLFVFGDSLVDAGNAQAGRRAAGGVDPAPETLGYFGGRFSNGPTFADYLSRDYLGQGLTVASAYGGINFSVGGAQAAEVAGDASPSFLEQITSLDPRIPSFARSGQAFGVDSLVLITLGGNDVRAEAARLVADPTYQPTFDTSVTALKDGLRELNRLGARNFLVTGLPDVGQIPEATGNGLIERYAPLTAASASLNTKFQQALVELGGETAFAGTDLTFFDFFQYQRDIYANPTAYGLSTPLNTRQACLSRPASAPACDGFVYFDTIHPTTQIHRAVAGGIASTLGLQAAAVPEPATWGAMVLGFGAAGAAMRRRRTRATVRLAA